MRGRETKKGKSGQAAQYVTRTSALKILQVTLKDFRRLCILKGIYPRDPKKKLKGKDKTYYHRKDIKFLSHEPLLEKFRQFKTFLKKYTKARGRKEWAKAKHIQGQKPTFALDHLIRERYPSFVDALRDLDDPLTMIHLFAGLQQKITRQHYAEHSETAQRLCREFQHYVLRSHSLRKVFVSIKGIYYQCQVMGQDVTWITPHKFSQRLPTDVDYRVMLTFLDFYITLLKFVNFKLYHDVGLKYPPVLDTKQADMGAALQAIKTDLLADQASLAAKARANASDNGPVAAASRGAQKVVDSIVNTMEDVDAEDAADADSDGDGEEDDEKVARDAMDEFNALAGQQSAGNGVDTLHAVGDRDEETRTIRQLFSGLSFFLSRETNQESLEFVLLNAGAVVHLDNDQTRKDIASGAVKVTHWVIDRPAAFNQIDEVEYVQPQWVYDSFNSRALLPTRFYAVGVALPPHLSPFVDDEKEGYIPKQRKMLEEWGASGEAGKQRVRASVMADQEEEEVDGSEEEDEEQEEYQLGLIEEAAGISYSEHKEKAASKKGKGADDSDDDEEDEEDEESSEDESEEEQDMPDAKTSTQDKAKAKAVKRKRVEEEAKAKELAKIMMDKKSARLYQRMQTGIAKKKTAVDALKTKRRKIEKEKKKQLPLGAAVQAPAESKPTPKKRKGKGKAN